MPTEGASFSIAFGVFDGEVRSSHDRGEIGASRKAHGAGFAEHDRVGAELANHVAE
jgi:hypothetical protein